MSKTVKEGAAGTTDKDLATALDRFSNSNIFDRDNYNADEEGDKLRLAYVVRDFRRLLENHPNDVIPKDTISEWP